MAGYSIAITGIVRAVFKGTSALAKHGNDR